MNNDTISDALAKNVTEVEGLMETMDALKEEMKEKKEQLSELKDSIYDLMSELKETEFKTKSGFKFSIKDVKKTKGLNKDSIASALETYIQSGRDVRDVSGVVEFIYKNRDVEVDRELVVKRCKS